MKYFCCDERRRNAVAAHPTLNGIDFLEVSDDPSDPIPVRQHRLFVHFVKDLAPGTLLPTNIRIEGGDRIRSILVIGVSSVPHASPPVSPPVGPLNNVLAVDLDKAGDFSPYTLRLVRDANHDDPPAGFDPVLSAVDFLFKIACPTDIDCRQQPVCPPEPRREIDVDYLAKDYASFRRLMLDRMTALMPDWQERNQADLGITLVELLAYVADRLSYQQDAIATEAYLGTARLRTSVRRQARLTDYVMHDGCNARVWVHIEARNDIDGLVLPRAFNSIPTKVISRVEGPVVMQTNTRAHEEARRQGPIVFELLHDVRLHAAHNRMSFYTWGARECCLPKGATTATLRGAYPHLQPGHVVILKEVRGPLTGQPEDANPARRHAVRLRSSTVTNDLLGDPLADPPNLAPIPITEIVWEAADQLPFPLTVSARQGTAFYDDVAVALGNTVLADHGETVIDEAIGPVPDADPVLAKVLAQAGDRCAERPAQRTPPRFQPRLKREPVTFAADFDAAKPPTSAAAAMMRTPETCSPQVRLRMLPSGESWEPRRDLLNSGPGSREFVVETESDGSTTLRFGDDRFGARPASGARFAATYRVGNGPAGNVGAEALTHIICADPAIVSDPTVIVNVSNPAAAAGGIEPESLEEVRQKAPAAFQVQERAVTPADYATVAPRCDPGIQRAVATMRWTGSWHTVFLTVDRLSGAQVDTAYKDGLRRCLDRYRMAGRDLEIDTPRLVPLEIEASICVKPGYYQTEVRAALQQVLSNRVLPDGRRALFHPDNFTFGQAVHLSPIYAAAQAVPGVASLEITKFRRQGIAATEASASGRLDMSRLEIARLDNDPNFRERGVLALTLRGGR